MHKVNHIFLCILYIANHRFLWYNYGIVEKDARCEFVPLPAIKKRKGVVMAISEAQKRASNKYHKENMATVGCKLRKEDAERFKEYAKTQNKTANGVLREFVYACIGKEK